MTASRYLDYAASTPLDPRVAEAMAAAGARPGNPSSVHSYGRSMRADIDRARASVASLFGAAPSSVTFTSGATEANALAILGHWRAAARANPGRKMAIVASPFEHASVEESLARLAAEEGAEVRRLRAGRGGIISSEEAAGAIGPDTALVTVMWVNNVLGSVQPVAEIGRIVAAERARRGSGGLPIAFHCDAVQAASSVKIRVWEAGVDLLTASAHKMYGPKGIGALVRADGLPVEPLYSGGGQEAGVRHGTENVPGIAGFGTAAEIAAARLDADAAHAAALRKILREGIAARAGRMEAVADGPGSSAGIAFLRHRDMPGDRLALLLDSEGFAVSAGSACDSGKRRGPRALAAVLDERRASQGGIRVSFGRFTTESEVRELVDALSRLSRA
ncbi:MAG: hypothetical protein RL272_536 [Candidatus Parcubacteria bacterium]|jgi:cysteine desulfurase